MNLDKIKDRELLETIQDFVRHEREVLTPILFHLKEIDRRRLYCDLKYESMREYAMAEADRRLAAMHVLAELPEVEDKIDSGDLSLTNLVLAQVVFNKESKAGRGMDAEAKLEFLEKLENKSTRQAQKIACEFCPEITPRDLEVYQLQDLELRHKAEKLIRLHGLENLSRLLHKLFDEEISRLEAPQFAAPRDSTTRDACTNCGSLFKPESDHILPKGVGGPDTPENLRALCRPCNQRAAIKFYGMRKMSQHLREPEVAYEVRM